ncbi:hypothetical protein POX_g08966 [Penicillium oxalicum]|uniref:Uncharacterized protein n=1 Tax=Penicillium oxalicum (strain 114-2 / CGMCC 5302) TaxID=933388 RepID=S7Z948_PENO1|nr:hypothetical protein POX_g08966 [Penicillium oxalicum]EPS26734.1 hypothetical protein PDE_01673 [Penicillium oxalicum 114-2]KAI2786579.1 hypothetical protein POX_g08966 [Penicillium oxalicum]
MPSSMFGEFGRERRGGVERREMKIWPVWIMPSAETLEREQQQETISTLDPTSSTSFRFLGQIPKTCGVATLFPSERLLALKGSLCTIGNRRHIHRPRQKITIMHAFSGANGPHSIVEEPHADILGDGPTEGAKDMVCIETGIRTDLFLPSSPRPLPIGQGFSPHAGSDLWADQIRDGILALGQGRHAGKVIETWQQD